MSVHFLPVADGVPNELCLLELQGSISGAGFDGKFLGTLSFNDKGQPELAIGSRVLEGKAEKLKAPIVATRRVAGSGPAVDYEVLGFVRQRLLFNTRPRIET